MERLHIQNLDLLHVVSREPSLKHAGCILLCLESYFRIIFDLHLVNKFLPWPCLVHQASLDSFRSAIMSNLVFLKQFFFSIFRPIGEFFFELFVSYNVKGTTQDMLMVLVNKIRSFTAIWKDDTVFKFDLFIDIRWMQERFNAFSRSLSNILRHNLKKWFDVKTLRTWSWFDLAALGWFLICGGNILPLAQLFLS